MFLDIEDAAGCPAFSWSTSLYVACKDDAEFDILFAGLPRDGFVMMEPEPVWKFRKAAWVTDKFGVTWQPVLE